MGIVLILGALVTFCIGLVLAVAVVMAIGMLIMRGIRALTTRRYKKKWNR